MSENLHVVKWDWLTNERYSSVLEQIQKITDPGMAPQEKRERITTIDGKLALGGLIVPYDMLPYLFENIYGIKILNNSNSTKYQFSGTRYDLYVDSGCYSYVDHNDGSAEFFKDGLRHCVNGPAYISKDKLTKYYCIDGKNHNLNGAALITATNKTYAINGEFLSLADWISENPKSEIKTGFYGSEAYHIAYFKQRASMTGVDGTRALLVKTEDEPNVDNFLLELIGRPMDNYRILEYQYISPTLQPIYDFIQKSGPWQYKTGEGDTKLLLPNSTTSLTLFKDSRTLRLESQDFGDRIQLDFDFSYEDGGPAQFPSIFIKHDIHGKKHCANGPAIKLANGTEFYYIHGSHISQYEHEAKRYDDGLSQFYWMNDDHRYHSPSTTCPAIICEDGTKKFYYRGMLHNDLFAAVEHAHSAYDIRNYYLFNNEVSYDEFKNYSISAKSVIFTDEDNLYHRDGGPAIINFHSDGTTTKKYFKHGRLHRSNGPAIIDTKNHTEEYWLNGYRANKESGNVEVKLKEKSPISRSDIKAVNLNGDAMNIKTIKVGQVGSDASDTRVQQVSSGTKLGLKKGILKVSSGKAASAIAGVLPVPDNVPNEIPERLAQLLILLGSAEIVDRLPDGIATKVGFNIDRRTEFSGLARFISGETLGRDAVNIVSSLAPMLMEAIQKLSAEDITDLANDFTHEQVVSQSQKVEEESPVHARR